MIVCILTLACYLWVASVECYSVSSKAAAKRHEESSTIYPTRFPNVTWDNHRWQLSTTNLVQGRFQSRMTVANGYHGISVAALGPFFEYDIPVDGDNISGWPLFSRRQTMATVGGFWDSQPRTNGTNFPWLYQYGWDTVISGIPHWGGIVIDLGNAGVLDASTDNSTIHGFRSTLDMQRGVLNWEFTWTPEDTNSYKIKYQMFAHKTQINQGFVKMTITACNDSQVTIVNVLNGDCAVRTNASGKGLDGDLIYSAVNPWGVENVTAYVYAGMSLAGAQPVTKFPRWDAPYIGGNASSIASAVNVRLTAKQTATVIKYVGVASSDAFSDPQAISKGAALAGQQTGYKQALISHAAEWAALFPKSSVDDFTYPTNGSLPDDTYVVEAAITAVTNPYHILQNTVSRNATVTIGTAPINQHSIAVGGLGSDSYAGQVFWDADVWMHPGLAASFPYAASGITNYRKRLYPQALANVATSYQSSKNKTSFTSDAAIFPWTSGRYGNCTGTGPCWDYQYHLNGDIVLALTSQWLATGDEDFLSNDLYPIANSVSVLYSELMQRNGSYWTLTNMTDPDEYANMVDNGGYTMPLIAETLDATNILRQNLSQSQSQNTTWTAQAQNILVGRNQDAGITLEYTGPMPQNGTITVKQADVVLVTYPLSYFTENYTAKNALDDLDYYANKQSADGPAMTWAIFSIVANEVSPSGCSAYTYQQYSYQPYVRAPWYQFSEQVIDDASLNGGTHPAFPFLTGHGGSHQVIIYGYLGLRYTNNGNLNIDPAPPPQLPFIRYRTFYWQGCPISAVSNQTHTTLSRQGELNPTSGVVPNARFANSSIPILVGSSADPTSQKQYILPPNGTLTVPNRQYWRSRTVPNNIAQCQSVPFSTSDYVPGQFPISAVDGATSTRWQPLHANQNASITVSLPLGHKVVGMQLDWGSEVPYNFSVTFHNDTLDTNRTGAISSSDGEVLTIASTNTIAISNPYQESTAQTIRPVSDNTTILSFNDTGPSLQTNYSIVSSTGRAMDGPFYTTRYATLAIWGNQLNASYTIANMSGDGATVAEWAIIVSEIADEEGGFGASPVAANKRDTSPGYATINPTKARNTGSGYHQRLRSSFLNKFGRWKGSAYGKDGM